MSNGGEGRCPDCGRTPSEGHTYLCVKDWPAGKAKPYGTPVVGEREQLEDQVSLTEEENVALDLAYFGGGDRAAFESAKQKLFDARNQRGALATGTPVEASGEGAESDVPPDGTEPVWTINKDNRTGECYVVGPTTEGIRVVPRSVLTQVEGERDRAEAEWDRNKAWRKELWHKLEAAEKERDEARAELAEHLADPDIDYWEARAKALATRLSAVEGWAKRARYFIQHELNPGWAPVHQGEWQLLLDDLSPLLQVPGGVGGQEETSEDQGSHSAPGSHQTTNEPDSPAGSGRETEER